MAIPEILILLPAGLALSIWMVIWHWGLAVGCTSCRNSTVWSYVTEPPRVLASHVQPLPQLRGGDEEAEGVERTMGLRLRRRPEARAGGVGRGAEAVGALGPQLWLT
jgi:hypothetical protein